MGIENGNLEGSERRHAETLEGAIQGILERDAELRRQQNDTAPGNAKLSGHLNEFHKEAIILRGKLGKGPRLRLNSIKSVLRKDYPELLHEIETLEEAAEEFIKNKSTE